MNEGPSEGLGCGAWDQEAGRGTSGSQDWGSQGKRRPSTRSAPQFPVTETGPEAGGKDSSRRHPLPTHGPHVHLREPATARSVPSGRPLPKDTQWGRRGAHGEHLASNTAPAPRRLHGSCSCRN